MRILYCQRRNKGTNFVDRYLTDNYDPEMKLSFAKGTEDYYECLSWLMWQMGGLGPMQGNFT